MELSSILEEIDKLESEIFHFKNGEFNIKEVAKDIKDIQNFNNDSATMEEKADNIIKLLNLDFFGKQFLLINDTELRIGAITISSFGLAKLILDLVVKSALK